MTTRCLTVEEITRLGTADGNDPRRGHVDSCARCAALATEYAEFVRARPADGADLGDANRRLAAFIAERIARDPVAASASRRSPRRFLDFSPRRMLMLAASAAVVVVLAVSVARQFAPDEMRLRGSASGVPVLEPHTVAADGSVELSWSAVEGADAYRVEILGADLSERAGMAPTRERSVVLSPAAFSLEKGAYYWQVTALAQGDAIAASAPARLRVE